MNSRELVKRTLEFDKPDSIPRQLWLLPWAENNHPDEVKYIGEKYPDDITWCPACLAEKPGTQGDQFERGTYIDEWGCVFENRHRGIIGEVKEPLVKDWPDLEKVRTPVECLSVDRDQVNAFCSRTDRFVLAGCCPRPFERIQFLRGTENVLMDTALRPGEFDELLDTVRGFYIDELEVWAKTDVDGLMFMDDWGSQLALLISPDSWREMFKPIYRDFIDIAHSHGKKAFMHSDGNIVDILDDLIELGLDAINSQVFCMGIEELGRRFAGRITFWGEVDRQHLLPNGTEEDIRDAVRSMTDNLYSAGGLIAQLEFGPGAKPENIIAAFDEWDCLTKQQDKS